eukprot:m.445109 g.445109  ORF g.445109 m.445109 type:complete len:272 (+) comp21491_c0_seq6:321-1136(+)
MGWTCVIIALLVISTRSQAQHYGQQYQTPKRVLLSEVRSLTLSKGQVTAGRRSSPVQQTSCIGGSGCGTSAEPAIIQCINQGSDGVDFQWKCTADLPGDYRFGETTVTCEGFEYADDPYVLAGSCGVEYTLERRLGMSGSHDQTRYFGSNQQYHYDWDNYDTESSWRKVSTQCYPNKVLLKRVNIEGGDGAPTCVLMCCCFVDAALEESLHGWCWDLLFIGSTRGWSHQPSMDGQTTVKFKHCKCATEYNLWFLAPKAGPKTSIIVALHCR